MDSSIGGTPKGSPESFQPGLSQVTETTTIQKTVPLVEPPMTDSISKMPDGMVKPLANYVASSGIPILPQPSPSFEKKEEKKTIKEEKPNEVSESSGDNLETEIHLEGEQKAEKEQESESGGQGSTDDSSSNSDGGQSNNSFSGNQNQREPSHQVPGSKITEEASVSNSNPVIKSKNAAENKEDSINGGTKINPLEAPTNVTTSGLYAPPVNPAQFFSNSQKIMSEIHAANMKFANSMPDGPDKIRFTDFLKLVQEALIGFQELLRTLQSSDSKGAKDRSLAKLETTLSKIEEQRKEQDEIYKKQADAAHKMQTMGPLMAFFAFLMVLLLTVIIALSAVFLLLSGPAGWMALGMLVCELIDQGAKMVGQKPFMMEKFLGLIVGVSNAIVESCAKTFNLSPEQVEDGKAIAKTVAVSVTMALALFASPAAFVFGGFMALLSFLNESHIIRDMEMRRGLSEVDAAKAEMYAQLAIGIAFAIATMALAFMMPPSVMATIGTAFVSMSEKLAKVALQVSQTITRSIEFLFKTGDALTQKIAKMIQAMIQVAFDPEIWVSVTSLGLQTTSAVMTYQYENLLADIALIQGQMDVEIELKETTIAILKKMIQQLLDGLQGTGDQISQIGQLLKKTHSDVSQISSSLFG